MPLYEYECPECGRMVEQYLTSSEANSREFDYRPLCAGDVKRFTPVVHITTRMRRVMSAPAPHRVGGTEGKLRTAEKVKKRNDDHFKSAKGQDEHRANVVAAHKRLGLTP